MRKNNCKDIKFLKLLQKGLPLTKKPFSGLAKAGFSEKETIQRIKHLKNQGKIRCLQVKVSNFREVYKVSALVAWQIPLSKIKKIGFALAKISEVTHCYQRPELPDFPFNLYTMIHTKTKKQLKEITGKISKRFKIKSYVVLYTVKRYKRAAQVEL